MQPASRIDQPDPRSHPVFHSISRLAQCRRFWRQSGDCTAVRQVGHQESLERYELRIAYREARELIMDILRHGSAITVVSPDALATAVRDELACALKVFR
jgi:predicted DNA-binding transcriptional regulator YafY